MKENDLLEQKLQNQEDDFRLQNEALMKELAQVLMRLFCFCITCRWNVHVQTWFVCVCLIQIADYVPSVSAGLTERASSMPLNKWILHELTWL